MQLLPQSLETGFLRTEDTLRKRNARLLAREVLQQFCSHLCFLYSALVHWWMDIYHGFDMCKPVTHCHIIW